MGIVGVNVIAPGKPTGNDQNKERRVVSPSSAISGNVTDDMISVFLKSHRLPQSQTVRRLTRTDGTAA